MPTKAAKLGLLALPVVFSVLSPLFCFVSGILVFFGSFPGPTGDHAARLAIAPMSDPIGLAEQNIEPVFDETFDETTSRRLLQNIPVPASNASHVTIPATHAANAAGQARFDSLQADGACHLEVDVDYHGHDIAHASVHNEAECCAFCRSTPKCCYFTFKPVNKFPKRNCWAKPFFKDAAKRRRVSPGHNSGHLTDGKCARPKKCTNTIGPMLRMWIFVTFGLAFLMSAALAAVAILDRVFQVTKLASNGAGAGALSLLHAIEAGERPTLRYVPFLLDFLCASSDRPVVAPSPSRSTLHVFTSVWATAVDAWYGFGWLLMVYTLLVCRAAMDFTWWMLLLLLVGWGALAVLALLYGMKRQGAVQGAVQQRVRTAASQQQPAYPIDEGAQSRADKRAHIVGPYTPIHTWDKRELVPNPHAQTSWSSVRRG